MHGRKPSLMPQGSEYERSRSKVIAPTCIDIDLIIGRKLATEAWKLEKMKFEKLWSKILANQENKKKIQEIFGRIDRYAFDFQVRDRSP